MKALSFSHRVPLRPRSRFNIVVILMLTLLTLAVTAQEDAAEPQTITLWSPYYTPSEVEQQQTILARFQEAHPNITVNLVVMNDAFMEQMMNVASANGRTPDLVLHPLHLTYVWNSQVLLDVQRATTLVDELGFDTFSANPLRLMRREDGQYRAVPSHGWSLILLYRRDLFDERNLSPPNSFSRVEVAAATLHDPDNGFYGFCGPGAAADVGTSHLVEHFALASGARFSDTEGLLAVDSPAFEDSLNLYADLMARYGPPSPNWDESRTRDAYLAGDCAMAFWPPSILDELAGLHERFLPTCDRCQNDPLYLARNTGLLTEVDNGAGRDFAVRAEVFSLGVTYGASDAALTFARAYFNEFYLDWLAMNPALRIPLRHGTPEEPQRFDDGWLNLSVGVDRRALLTELYGEEPILSILNATRHYNRLVGGPAYPRVPMLLEKERLLRLNAHKTLTGEFSPHSAMRATSLTLEALLREAPTGEEGQDFTGAAS